MTVPKKPLIASALILAAAIVPSSAAWAECSLSIDLLGRRIAEVDAQQKGAPSHNEVPVSVSVMNEKLRETTADLAYGARGYDITRNRLATARETSARDTVPPSVAGKSGVVHFNGKMVTTPEDASGPLARAEDYWRQARQLYARGAQKACSQAVAKGNAALDAVKG
jgi:hypothetical protein